MIKKCDIYYYHIIIEDFKSVFDKKNHLLKYIFGYIQNSQIYYSIICINSVNYYECLI